MIAIARRELRTETDPPRQTEFEKMLPQIEARLRFKFRFLRPEARQEALQEGTVNCLSAFRRLVRQGRRGVASANTLALFAVRQVKAGRTVATRLNQRDPLSRYAQRYHGSRPERLDRRERGQRGWVEIVIEDRRARVVDQVALRIDIPDWLRQFPRRTQRIARDLAHGWTTAEVARKYRLSAGRISQLRRKLYLSWREFQGEAIDSSRFDGRNQTKVQRSHAPPETAV